MANNNKYKVKSDYTFLRKKHQTTDKGDIFENDIMTITPLDSLFGDGQEILYSDSNFKFSTRTDIDLKRKYNRNTWLKTPDGSEVWTLEDLNEAPISDESKIRIKPNYNSIRDFAYYGSATEMVHATVNHVIKWFPAEIYFGDEPFEPLDRNGNYVEYVMLDGEKRPVSDFRIAHNEFGINFESDFINEENIENPYRYLTLSIQDYVKMKDGEVIEENLTKSNFHRNPDYDGCNDGILGCAEIGGIKVCIYVQNGEKIYIYEVIQSIDIDATGHLVQDPAKIDIGAIGHLVQDNVQDVGIPAKGHLKQEYDVIDINIAGKGHLLQQEPVESRMTMLRSNNVVRVNTNAGEIEVENRIAGTSIRPNEAIVIEYFETIDEFESILLNRQSKPIYKAVFETPHETDNGYEYTMEPYTWPSRNNWNPQITTTAFNSYLFRLISLAQYHDEFDSNNIWRMMTHEAIKNLDWTFFRHSGDDIEDLSNIDSSRIEAVLQLYARQYDGLKRYIDNIKFSNNVSYDQKNNLPDYHLTDVVELSGFDAILPNPTAKTNVVTEALYSGFSTGYNEVDGNTQFMRNLKINSHYINSLKGTREGLETMFGLLGLKPTEYRIKEHIGVAQGGDVCKMDIAELRGLEATDRFNCKYPDAIDVEVINGRKDNYPINESVDDYYGIACKPVVVRNYDDDTIKRYVIPWYDPKKEYDNGLYFQMKGGWGKKPIIDVSELQIQGYDVKKYIPSGLIAGDNFYDETKNRLKFASDIYEMIGFLPNEVSVGDICYVNDISALREVMDGFYIINSGNNPETAEMTEDGNTVYSHYFVLDNIFKTNAVGLFGGCGWRYIYLKDILNASSVDGTNVLYQEAIKEKTNGNNPHIAKTAYDDGAEYVRVLSNIFEYNIKNNNFSRFSTLDVESAITTYDFNIKSGYTDNRKVDYFRPRYKSDLTVIEQTDGNTYDCKNTLPEVENMLDKSVTEGICGSATSVDMNILYNPEGGNNYMEPASYSLVNLKNMRIEFVDSPVDEPDFKREWQDYIRKVVVEYMKQLLPSTTIFEWGFCNDFSEPIGIHASGTVVQDITEMSIPGYADLEQISGEVVIPGYAGLVQSNIATVTEVKAAVRGNIRQNSPILDYVSVNLAGRLKQNNE